MSLSFQLAFLGSQQHSSLLSFVPCMLESSASLTEFSAEGEGVQQVHLVHITLEM